MSEDAYWKEIRSLAHRTAVALGRVVGEDSGHQVVKFCFTEGQLKKFYDYLLNQEVRTLEGKK